MKGRKKMSIVEYAKELLGDANTLIVGALAITAIIQDNTYVLQITLVILGMNGIGSLVKNIKINPELKKLLDEMIPKVLNVFESFVEKKMGFNLDDVNQLEKAIAEISSAVGDTMSEVERINLKIGGK